jgi:thiol-disulfide isomerase/thioredoxin
MRPSALLFLVLPGIMQAQSPVTDGQTILDQTRAQAQAYSKDLRAFLDSGQPFSAFTGSLAKEIQANQARLAKEKRPQIRQALAVALAYQFMVDTRAVTDPANGKSPSLAGIPALSKVWSMEPRLIVVAAQAIKDPVKRKAFLDQAREKHPDSSIREVILFDEFFRARRSKEEANWRRAFSELEQKFPASQYTKMAQEQVKKDGIIQVGNPAPAFTIPSLEDPSVTYSLDGFKGHYLLVDFWATWCGPCVASIPGMDKCYRQYHERGLDILSVADEKSAAVVTAFRTKPGMAMPWKQAVCIFDPKTRSRSNPISDAYGIQELPTLVLIGPDGKIVAKGEELHEHLDQVLARFLPGAVDYAALDKEGEAILAKLQEQAKAHHDAGKPMNEFQPDLAALTASVRERRQAATGELREALTVLEFAVAGQYPAGQDVKSHLLKEVPPEAKAWTIAWNLAPYLDKIVGPEAESYMEAMKTRGIPEVRAEFLCVEATTLIRAGRMEQAKALLNTLQKEFPSHESVKGVVASYEAESRTALGGPAPVFSIPNLDNPTQTFTLQNFKGKYLLMDFWGTWCGWCVKELPETHRLYATYHSKGLEILSLASNKSAGEVTEFRKKPGLPMPWNHALLGRDQANPNPMLASFGIQGFPTLFLIGPDGTILAKGDALRAENLEKTLAKYLTPGS